jgi:hypothetical protein
MTIIQATLMVGPTGPHVTHVIKQSDSTGSGPPAWLDTDGELQATLHANTLYEIRVGVRMDFTVGVITGNRWRLSPSTSVAHAALTQYGPRIDQADAWAMASADPTSASMYNTFHFNADDRNCASGNETTLMYGMIKTSGSPCTIVVKFGSSSANPNTAVLRAGSWLYAREQEEI